MGSQLIDLKAAADKEGGVAMPAKSENPRKINSWSRTEDRTKGRNGGGEGKSRYWGRKALGKAEEPSSNDRDCGRGIEVDG
jgi:hypothetical protein